MPAAAVSSRADAQAWIPGVWDEWSDRYLQSYVRLASARPAAAGPAAVMAAARQSRRVADALKPYVKDGDHGPHPLAPPVY